MWISLLPFWSGVPDLEHGPQYSCDWREPVPRHEDDHDAVAAAEHAHEDVRAGARRACPVPRPRAQRAGQLLHGVRGGGESRLFGTGNYTDEDLKIGENKLPSLYHLLVSFAEPFFWYAKAA